MCLSVSLDVSEKKKSASAGIRTTIICLRASLYCIILQYAMLCCAMLYYTKLYCSMLCYTTLPRIQFIFKKGQNHYKSLENEFALLKAYSHIMYFSLKICRFGLMFFRLVRLIRRHEGADVRVQIQGCPCGVCRRLTEHWTKCIRECFTFPVFVTPSMHHSNSSRPLEM
jgi:hypothetical protein